MKIAILGTKGIPNHYGGYEQFAEFCSQYLVSRGHEVTVYNPSFHPFKEDNFKGVRIIHKYSPEPIIGGSANFIYDFLCLRDALQRDFDIIYEAGYHSVAPSLWWFNVRSKHHPVVVTNMDGLEYNRSKWSFLTRRLIVYLEKLAVHSSPHMIADNLGIKDYYRDRFGRESTYLPYGANPAAEMNEEHLRKYELSAFRYCMLVARLEPENNIETILEGYVHANPGLPILVVGNHMTRYGAYLKEKYSHPDVRFTGGIYDKNVLDSLRGGAQVYFHGHSVGGTNPSLLEAMASRAFIAAHDNPFNRAVLSDDALYFTSSNDVTDILTQAAQSRTKYAAEFIESNITKIREQYNWETVVSMHEDWFKSLLKS